MTLGEFTDLLIVQLEAKEAVTHGAMLTCGTLKDLIKAALAGERPHVFIPGYPKRLLKKTRAQRANPYMDVELGPEYREEVRVVNTPEEHEEARRAGFVLVEWEREAS
jgi:hypothetical protein